MNFEKLFKDYHVPYTTKVNRGWINVDCPFCTSEHPMHLGFNPVNDYCTCWNCGYHGLKSALSKVLSVPYTDMDDVINMYSGRGTILSQMNKKVAKAKNLILPSNGFTSAERNYLLSRNFYPRKLHEKYGVVGGGIVGRWKHRILIPVYIDGKLVSWTGRSILDKNTLSELEIPRYKNLSIEESVVNIKECLFNIDNCRGDTAVLVEGSFDVMRLGDSFMCSMGTSLTQNQIKIIADKFKHIIISFDNEPDAQKKAKKTGLLLSALGVDVDLCCLYALYNKNDGGELSVQEVIEIRDYLRLN